uniref:WAP, follistatin/kazal, immunoglobulin, kunitz and netrin domain containing 2 n=1 Tax=Salarias fasciatus TaxID=181472 RepID=A0A672I1P4_SALFA
RFSPRCMWWMLFPRWIWFLALAAVWMELRVAVLPHIIYSHAGVCPNDVNPNLWVDAMSTCIRECESDQECETFEKCCQNVCGNRSCVAARSVDGKKGTKEATCASFLCTQQGSECDIWDGQPVCKCRDRCEREPHFTCACSKGITLSVVTCRFHLTWPNTSPSLPQAPPSPQPPALVGGPVPQTVNVGDTASFLCDVTGRPRPEITWEKQLPDGVERAVMRPNQVGEPGGHQHRSAGHLQRPAAGFGGLHLQGPEPVRHGSGQPPAHRPPHRGTENPGAQEPDPLPARRVPETPRQPRGLRERAGESQLVLRTQNQQLLLLHTLPQLQHLQGPCKAYEPRWAYSGALRQCQSFVYGGCEGNDNNFESKEACEETCPYPKNHHCKACKPRGKIVTSFCRSDFVVGRMTELTEEKDSGHALVTVEEILKDEKMGLRFFGKEPLEVTFVNMDWNCPCPNITGAAAEGQVIIMGNVNDGMAVLQPESYVGASSPRRVRKLKEVVSKNTCDILKAITNSPQ